MRGRSEGRLSLKAQKCAKNKHIWKGVVSNSDKITDVAGKTDCSQVVEGSDRLGSDKGQWKVLLQ